MVDWLSLVTEQGYERRDFGDHPAVEIPIYEAIYASQLLSSNRNNQAYIETADGAYLNFPNPTPHVPIRDVTLDFTVGRTGEEPQGGLFPLLSPSLQDIRRQFPEFFAHTAKYLALKRWDPTEYRPELNMADRICISFPDTADGLREHVTTYLASLHLRRQGYIVDPFSEALAGKGFPDLFAIKLPQLQQALADAGITGGGFYLNELELLNVPGENTRLPSERNVAVLEIESAGRFYAAKDEAIEYWQTGGWFDEGYGVAGFVSDRLASWEDRLDVGFITFDESGTFHQHPCAARDEDPANVDQVAERVENIVKQVLLKNLDLTETLAFLGGNTFYDAATAVEHVSLEEIIERVS